MGKTYTIVYQGTIPSLNSWYASSNWTKRANDKNKFSKIFAELLSKAKVPFLDKFRIEMRYKSRHDPDNSISILKMFVDTMKGQKIIIDDTKKFYKGLSITPDDTLDSNTFVINIIEVV